MTVYNGLPIRMILLLEWTIFYQTLTITGIIVENRRTIYCNNSIKAGENIEKKKVVLILKCVNANCNVPNGFFDLFWSYSQFKPPSPLSQGL